ncbi:uncharacterized protein LOC110173896 isoform X2 [Boleophthalmus pectinirostris]|uniref:uncharacterized protein LOC110173896 isoform X2 n=1 Tax=Boleophthalmus pectinirostris TaxID=150288 RepID=UPI0024323271|nr:uncharacterized protein LOC110173896 isoform X2 [Boleophthalmus pectinirostris]
MAEFTAGVLLLTVFVAEWAQSLIVFVREGEEAIITCPDVPPGHSMSERLTLTEQCGLKIQDVRPQEAGLFHCRLYQTPGGAPIAQASVPLSIVSLTEEVEEQRVKLICAVSSRYGDTVKWLYRGRNMNKSSPEIITSINITTVWRGSILTVPKGHFLLQEKHLLKCEVTLRDKTEEFIFKPKSADSVLLTEGPGVLSTEGPGVLSTEGPGVLSTEGPGVLSTEGPGVLSTEGPGVLTGTGELVRHVVLSLLLSALLLSVTVVLVCTRIQGRKTQTDRTRVGTVVYENIGEPSVRIRMHAAPPAAPQAQ